MTNRNYIYNNDIIKFVNVFENAMKKNINRQTIVVCIGTDKSTGDCLGPLVGTILERLNLNNIYGTLQNPIHALNLEQTVENIYKYYTNPFIVAVDASLGKYQNIGAINIREGSLAPGSAISKQLINVGDISVTGVVNSYSLNGFYQLQSSRLSVVMDMAYIIGKGIHKVLQKYEDLH